MGTVASVCPVCSPLYSGKSTLVSFWEILPLPTPNPSIRVELHPGVEGVHDPGLASLSIRSHWPLCLSDRFRGAENMQQQVTECELGAACWWPLWFCQDNMENSRVG